MSEQWIVIPNWEKFQHYKDRDPSWIKLYTELEHRDDWLHLTLAERGLLVCIWIEYTLRNGELRSADLPSFVLQKIPRRSLDSLQAAGFIEVSASKPSRARAGARSREEETETETPKPPSEKGATNERKKKPRVRPTGWREVRGSHGIDYIPDPFGTDKPPYAVSSHD